MIVSNDYVAGWLDSSVHDFLKEFPSDTKSAKYVLVTCLDSNLDPHSLLSGSALPFDSSEIEIVGKALLMPTATLIHANQDKQLLFGFDEVWFFPSRKITPKPSSAWLVGPARIAQKKLDKLSEWMNKNSCSLAMGDGEGLNFIIKARGLVRPLLAHTIEQRQPEGSLSISSDAALAG
jgi:hypothetical protein